MTERRIVAFAVFATLLLMAAPTATVGATSDELVVGSSHTDFGTGDEPVPKTLQNMTVEGSGDSASVTLQDASGSYSVVANEGDGTAGEYTRFLGDTAGNSPNHAETLINPDSSGTLKNLSVAIRGTAGSDYGFTVDIYIIQEGPDQTYGEGTLIKDNWNPSFSTGTQTVSVNAYDVTAGTNYTIEFVVSGTDSDGVEDALELKLDSSAPDGELWYTSVRAGTISGYYPDVSVGYADTPATATYVSANHSVTDPEQLQVNLSQLSGEVTITVEYWTGSGWSTDASTTVSSAATVTLNLSASAPTWRTRISWDKTTSSPAFTMTAESILFTNHAPSASGASPNGVSTNNESVTLSAQVTDAEFGTAQGETVQVDVVLDGSVVHTETINSNQTVSTTVSGLSDGQHSWHLVLNDSYGASTTTTSWSFTVNHYAADINESSAKPVNKTVTTAEFDLTIDVSDRDFAEPSGDQINVSFYVDGEYRGSDVGTANGTYSVHLNTMSGGSHTWHVVVRDEYGLTATSKKFSFEYPSQLEIRNETGTHQILNLSAPIEVTFYTEGKIVTKTANDGLVNLTGLPVNQEFVVTVKADGWYSRRILLDSLTSQHTIYLLNKSEAAVYNEFVLRDLTGNYPRKTTRLYIKRGMNVSGESGYYTIAGDYFGATGTFPVYLLKDARYKIVLETKSGRKTTIGAYLAASKGLKTIRVGTIEFDYPEGDSYRAEAVLNETSNTLIWKYSDPSGKTKDLHLVVHQRGNESNVLYEDSINQLGNYTLSLHIPSLNTTNGTQKQWVIEWNATRGGEKISATTPFTVIPEYPIPLGAVWKAGISFVMVAFVAALGGGRYSPEGAIATVAIAGLLMGFGFADIYPTFWWIAAFIAVGGYLWERGVPR